MISTSPRRGRAASATIAHPSSGGQVSFYEQLFREAFRTRPRRRQHLCTEFAKQVDRRSAGAFRAAVMSARLPLRLRKSIIT